MKFVVSIALLAVAFVVSAQAVQFTLQYFQAKSNGNAIVVEWKSANESDVAQYEIERAGADKQYRYVATIQAKGSNQSYSYNDTEAFGKAESDKNITANYFTYRLKVVTRDKNASYSNTIGVAHNVSGIKRTWGMIKEMFR